MKKTSTEKKCLFDLSCLKSSPSEKTKEQLIQNALLHFARFGYEGASLRDICKDSGTNVSSVKYHFGDKANLYKACIQHFIENRLKKINLILTPSENLEEYKVKMKLFLIDFVDEGLSNIDLIKLINREIENLSPMMEDVFQNTFLRLFEKLVSISAHGIEKGYLRRDIDPVTVAKIILNTINMAIRNDHISERYFNCSLKDNVYKEQLISEMISIIINGMNKRESV